MDGTDAVDQASGPQHDDPSPIDPLPQLMIANDDVWREMTRADAKSGHLLAIFGVALAGVVALAGRSQLQDIVQIMLWIAVVPMATAWILLLLVVRPNYRNAPYSKYANLTIEQLVGLHAVDPAMWRAQRLQRIAAVVCKKFRNIRWAVHLMLIGGGILIVAALAFALLPN